MSVPRYAEYKESGDAWVPEAPAHWELVALSRVLAASVTDGPHLTPVFCDEGVPFLSVDGIQDGELVFENSRFISDEDHAQFTRKAAPKRDDILMGKAASIGKIARVKTDIAFSIWSPLALIRFSSDLCMPGFAEYVLKSTWLQAQIETRANSNTQLNIGMKDIPKLRILLPPLHEQRCLTAFLDRETGKINGLIAEQEKLIALLAEKRQATISHAVTRGLNPDAPMKNSGVTWLGEVPAHWLTGKIQSFARRESGHTPSRQRPEYWENCTFPWFSLADVWQIREGIVKYVYETKEKVSALGLANSSARLLPTNTVMLSRTASVGYSAIMGCDMATTQDFINWVCGPLLKPEFLLHVLRGMRPEFDRLMMGSTHQTIYMPDVAKLMMTLPPLIEQEAIIAFIDRETAKLDALKAGAEHATVLLKERRSALIAAAVTGQIDVRNS